MDLDRGGKCGVSGCIWCASLLTILVCMLSGAWALVFFINVLPSMSGFPPAARAFAHGPMALPPPPPAQSPHAVLQVIL